MQGGDWDISGSRKAENRGCQRSLVCEQPRAWGIKACLGVSAGALLLVPPLAGPSPGTPGLVLISTKIFRLEEGEVDESSVTGLCRMSLCCPPSLWGLLG